MVTLKDVAHRANVSIATVSSVINDSRPVAADTRKRVENAIEELGYRPNRIAQALKKGDARKVVYITPSITNLVFSQYVYETQQILTNMDYELVLYNNEARKDLTQAYLGALSKPDISGVIITQTTSCGKVIVEACRQRSIPVVVFAAPDLGQTVTSVLSDEQQGTRKATEHLLACGHRKIGFCMVKGSTIHRKRFAGYLDALENAGLQMRPDLLIECTTHDELGAYVAMKRHIEVKGHEFTGLICCNDFMAFGVLRVFREFGIRIPHDVSLIGYDDSIAHYLHPSLTTVSPPKTEMAEAVVNILHDHIESGSSVQRTVFPQRLVMRNSTGVVQMPKEEVE